MQLNNAALEGFIIHFGKLYVMGMQRFNYHRRHIRTNIQLFMHLGFIALISNLFKLAPFSPASLLGLSYQKEKKSLLARFGKPINCP
jgi:hypothetical protein